MLWLDEKKELRGALAVDNASKEDHRRATKEDEEESRN